MGIIDEITSLFTGGRSTEAETSTKSSPTIFTSDMDPAGGGNSVTRLVHNLPGHGLTHKLALYTFYAIREALPVVNDAISKRRFLEGEMIIEAEDQGLQRELREFARNVVVGFVRGPDPTKGLNTYLDDLADNADTYGLGVGEIVLDEAGQEIDRLVVPSSRTFEYRKESQSDQYWRLYQQDPDDPGTGWGRAVDGSNIQLLGFRSNPEGPWPLSMLWGLPFVAQVVIRMLISVDNLWWTAGDPASVWNILYDPEHGPTDQQMSSDIAELEETVKQILKLRRSGKVAEGFLATKGSKLQREVLAGNITSESMAGYFREHYEIIAGQVMSRSDVPSWMFGGTGQESGEGLNSKRAQLEGSAAMAAAVRRNRLKAQIARDVLNTYLVLDGSAGRVGQFSLTSEYATIHDEKLAEETRTERENANRQAIENAQRMLELGMLDEVEDRNDYLRNAEVLPEA